MHDDNAKISVISVKSNELQVKKTFNFLKDESEETQEALKLELFDLFDRATILCAYNGFCFDLPFIEKQLKPDKGRISKWYMKLFDPFWAMKVCFGRTCKLDDLLRLNGMDVKSGDGMGAIVLANEKRWVELEDYCMKDVELTLSVCERDYIRLFKSHGDFYMCYAPGKDINAFGRFVLMTDEQLNDQKKDNVLSEGGDRMEL